MDYCIELFVTGEAKAMLAKAEAKAEAIELVANALGKGVSIDFNILSTLH